MLPSFKPEQCIGCLQCARACPMGVIGRDAEGRPGVLPRRRCIACMHCAAICPRRAVSFEGLTPEQLYRPTPESPVERLIRQRRSVRNFKEALPDREVLQWALDTAEYAPSGKNVHATRWTVLWGKAVTDRFTSMALEICEATGEAPELPKLYRAGVNLLTCNAPCVVIGWSPEDCLNPVIDTALAMSTLEMLLLSRGISTCWGGYLNQLANRHDSLRSALGIPEGCKMRCALMVGYPDRETYRNIPYRPDAAVTWLEE